jgi:L-rhamnose isomerase / sugar isomerase
MKLDPNIIAAHNDHASNRHSKRFNGLKTQLEDEGIHVEYCIKLISDLQIAIPSWALGTGGTRFGRFPKGGEPGTLEQKLEDVGLLHALTNSCGAISLHIPWDIPEDADAIKQLADSLNVKFDAVNSNTFQDQENQEHSYKFGSLCHSDQAVRDQAIQHNKEVIDYGHALGSEAITVWLADGSTFPGQQNFRHAFQNTLESLKEIYTHLPESWSLFTEHKPYEPNFYSSVVQDWGSSLLLAQKLGDQARCLVDLGHHLPNTNIEQIVSRLMMEGKLGGFHFNDSKYGDDDLTVGSMKPYQLFLIFNELVEGMNNPDVKNPAPAWMIDASHNVKDPLEDLLQSLEAIRIAYAQALLVDQGKLAKAQFENDVSLAQEILQAAFRTDVRPLLSEARIRSSAANDPLELYRTAGLRNDLVLERGEKTSATGL